jgi:hypothetical protein
VVTIRQGKLKQLMKSQTYSADSYRSTDKPHFTKWHYPLLPDLLLRHCGLFELPAICRRFWLATLSDEKSLHPVVILLLLISKLNCLQIGK